MNTKCLDEMKYVGNIIVTHQKKPITKLYKSNKRYYILDVVVNTNFKQYYAYEVPLKNIQSFLKNKRNAHIRPQNNQLVYRVHFFDFEIYEAFKYTEEHESKFTLNSNDFECEDLEKITNLINKTDTNELHECF